MADISQPARHSADVQMELIVNGRTLAVVQMGPGFLVLNPPVDLPPATGEVSLRIDGRESRFTVRLDRGASSLQPMTAISALAQTSAA